MVTDIEGLEDKPGTVLPVAGDPLRFYVRGRHDWWYEIRIASEAGPAHCECDGFKYRGRCWHVDRGTEFVAEGKRAAQDRALQWYLGLSEEERKAIWR